MVPHRALPSPLHRLRGLFTADGGESVAGDRHHPRPCAGTEPSEKGFCTLLRIRKLFEDLVESLRCSVPQQPPNAPSEAMLLTLEYTEYVGVARLLAGSLGPLASLSMFLGRGPTAGLRARSGPAAGCCECNVEISSRASCLKFISSN